jgi:hypothetical protein
MARKRALIVIPEDRAEIAAGETIFRCWTRSRGSWRLQRMHEIICYCFGYTRADIARDLRENGRSTILERIAAAKRLGTCQCATKNPKGT